MAIEDIIYYVMLAVQGLIAVVLSVMIWQMKRDPEYRREEKFIRDLNEIRHLMKKAEKYAKLTNTSLDKFIAEVEKEWINKKEKD